MFLDSGGQSLIIGSSTLAVAAAPTELVTSNPPPSYLAFGSQTVQAGGDPVTLSGGTVISLVSGGASVVVDGSTQAIDPIAQVTTEQVYVLGSQTLDAEGAAVTVSGTVLSLAADGSSIVIGGTTTIAVAAASELLGKSQTVAQTGNGLGGIIASLGGFENPETAVVFATSTANISSSETLPFNGATAVPWNGTMFTGAGVIGAGPGASICWAPMVVILIGLKLLIFRHSI